MNKKLIIFAGIAGFIVHSILIIGDIFTANAKFNLILIYDSLGDNKPDIFIWLGGLIISLILSILFYILRKARNKKIETKQLKTEILSFLFGSMLAFLGLMIFIWLAFKDSSII